MPLPNNSLRVLVTLAVLTLVLPSFTSTTVGPTLSPTHLVLFAVFLFLAIMPRVCSTNATIT